MVSSISQNGAHTKPDLFDHLGPSHNFSMESPYILQAMPPSFAARNPTEIL